MPVTVQPGDTLWSIAQRTLGDGNRYPELFALNRDQLADPNQIEPGQVLRLPGEAAPEAAVASAAPTWTESWSAAASDAWGELRAGWEVVRQQWSAGWQAMDDQASALYTPIEQAPESFRSQVEGFVAALAASKENLVWIRNQQQHLSPTERPQLDQLAQRYNDLAAGFLSDVEGGESLQLGAAPLLMVGGLVVGVAAIAWSVTAYEHAANLRDQTALFREDLEARVKASEQGRTLQPATVPQPTPAPPPGLPSIPSIPSIPPMSSGSASGGWWLVGLGLAAAALALPPLWSALKPSRS